MNFDNELASSGGLLTFITLILVCGFLAGIIGMPVDTFVSTHNSMIGAYPTSQDSVNTGENLVLAFRVMCFMLFLAIGLNYLNVSQSEAGGDV